MHWTCWARWRRIQRPEACDVLYRLVVGSTLPAGARDESLAERFFNAGFVGLATEHWMTVAQGQEPTAPAFTGLAKAVLAGGLGEEAIAHADEAVAADPASDPARRLASVLRAAPESACRSLPPRCCALPRIGKGVTPSGSAPG